MKPKELPSKSYLHKVFYYKNGNLFWKIKKHRSRLNPGDLAGRILHTNRYQIGMNGKQYMRSRIVAKMFFPDFSENLLVDHINGNTLDDRIENLRMVTQSQNSRNTKKSTRNSSGHVGIYWREATKRWRVCIGVDGKPKEIGTFTELTEAIKCRKEAEKKLGYHKNHGRTSAILIK
jgi:hypothetical protein